MTRRIGLHILYWILILIFLSIFFGFIWKSGLLAFYFSSLLLPIVIGTTYYFNFHLVPQYLLKGKYRKFSLYFFSMLVISLYLEMLVALVSFLFIAEASTAAIELQGLSIFILGITLYLIVFISSFIRLLFQLKKNTKLVENLQTEQEKNAQQSLLVKVNRKNHQVPLNDLLYIESLSDYVKIVTSETELTTRERITHLDSSLPQNFIRIHRSFIINKEKVNSFSNTEVMINGNSIPISRTYKKTALEVLEAQQIKPE
ncbi:LytTR family transcriptional regulator [Gramella sp. GC03-9]|uniref:LytTR family transcriptional regulator n=1 Tax=Christiangramia oceanisediminis TaxID=2920386 RepID=A0A9X2R9I2_9FLAO|nr:LytTR family DNA-binding domain-containing protein [Gramella oceanisediminis]MCP9200843.1 LytTR family transcriptional regulator [Gramella oceanisediminis]